MRPERFTCREMVWRFAAFVVVAAVGSVLFGSRGAEAEDLLPQLRKNGVIHVAFTNEAPWSFADSSGKPTGAGPVLVGTIFKQLGVPKLDGTLTEFSALIPGLQADRFTMVSDTMYIKPARCQQVSFSQPLMCVLEAMAVKKGNPLGIETYADIARTSARFGVVGGSAQIEYAKEAGVTNLVTFMDFPSAIEGLEAGRVDAVAHDSLGIRDIIKRKGAEAKIEATKLFVAELKGKPQYGCAAFAFRRQDTSLRDEFNKGLEAMIKSGEAAKLIEPFVGNVDEEMKTAQGLTVAQLCAGQ